MAEKNEVFKQEVKHKGFFHYSDFYSFCYNWLKDEGYSVAEKKYEEKVSGFGKEITIEWEAKKKVSDYYRNIIGIKWHILGMNDAEVEVDGKKQKTNKGEVKLKVAADLERDYEQNWDKNPLWKFMRGVYDKYVIRTTTEEYESRLKSKGESFVENAKSFLRLEGKR